MRVEAVAGLLPVEDHLGTEDMGFLQGVTKAARSQAEVPRASRRDASSLPDGLLPFYQHLEWGREVALSIGAVIWAGE